MIRFEQVSFRYGTDEKTSPTIVGEVSLCVRPGECVGLVGNNGSGKSTIALLAKGLLLPVGGTVTVEGVDTRLQSDGQKTRVGLLFQDPDHQIVGTTIREDIAFGLENIGIEPEEIERRIQTEAGRLGLFEVLDQPIHTLSGGTRQKAALAAVLAADPGFLILDEPTSQLDPWARDALWKHLEEVRTRAGLGLLVISQHRTDIERSDRVLVLSGGKLLAEGSLSSIIDTIKSSDIPDDPYLIFRQSGTDERGTDKPKHGVPDAMPVQAPTGHGIECMDISVGYHGTSVRTGLSGQFRTGGVNLIVGPSGSGKTTLLASMAGFLPMIGGRIEIDGSSWNPEGRIGLAFQNPERLFFCETVGEEVCFALLQKGAEPAQAELQGRAWLDKWGVHADSFWARSPLRLSGGEMRRVALAACTIANPDLLLLDEPLAGLDAAGRRRVSAIIAELARDRIVICVTHDPEEHLGAAASVLLLHGEASTWFETGSAFIKAVNRSPDLFPMGGSPRQGAAVSVDRQHLAAKRAAPAGSVPEAIARERETWMFRLHPLVKGAGALAIIIMLSLSPGSFGLTVFWLAGPLLAAILGGAPVGEAFRDLRRIWFLIFLVAAVNIAAGGQEAVSAAIENVLRLCGVCMVATIYVGISTQAELMTFWETCFRPLSIFGVNIREPALVMVIAVRFLPVMLEEIERIRLAQRARGARFNAGWGGSVVSLLPLLVPTLTLAIRRAQVLAIAMEARGYRLSGHRTKYKVYRFSAPDYGVALILCTSILGSVFIK